MRLVSSLALPVGIKVSASWRSPAEPQSALRIPGLPLSGALRPNSLTFAWSSFSFSSRRLPKPSAVGWCATIKTSSVGFLFAQLKILRILRVPSELRRYSSANDVSAPASKVNDVGRSSNSQQISTLLSAELTLASPGSMATTSLLKKISRASKIEDFPMSFLPTTVVRSLVGITTSSE
ncbi:hypothetical protein D9M68_755610 [compost metagenome]